MTNIYGENALMFAARGGTEHHLRIAELLIGSVLAKPAISLQHVLAKNNEGQTAIGIAREYGNQEMVAFLQNQARILMTKALPGFEAKPGRRTFSTDI